MFFTLDVALTGLDPLLKTSLVRFQAKPEVGRICRPYVLLNDVIIRYQILFRLGLGSSGVFMLFGKLLMHSNSKVYLFFTQIMGLLYVSFLNGCQQTWLDRLL